MKKKFLSCLLVLCMMFSLLSTTTVLASGIVDSGTCGENLTWSLDSEGVLTISGTGDMTEAPWSSHQSDIIKVVFNEGVTSICDYAFAWYWNLSDVLLSDSITTIGLCAFNGCGLLEKINIPQGVTGIGNYAFLDCTAISEITVDTENTNYSSENGVLYDKSKSMLIYYPSRKADSIFVIPSTVINIKLGALSNCLNVEKFEISKTNQFYQTESGVLFDKNMTSLLAYPCEKKDVEYFVPDSVKSIEYKAFSGNKHFTEVYLPNTLNTINSYAFSNCSELQKIVIPNSVKDIANWAFSNCGKLKNITLPQNLNKISDYLFSYCDNLESVIIPNNVTEIGQSAFISCKSLQQIIIPNNVTEIGQSAFTSCKSLQQIIIPNTVTIIGKQSFENCAKLSVVKISNNTTAIGSSAFRGCSNITDFSIPYGIENLDSNILYECVKLKTVKIPKTVTSIADWAFTHDDSLTDVYYEGAEEEWNKITIGNYNDPLTKATIHYNYICTNTSVTKEGDETIISVIPANAPNGVSILVGLYKNGQFVDIATAVYDGNDITVKTTKDFDNIKVMMWHNLQNLSPVCRPEEL